MTHLFQVARWFAGGERPQRSWWGNYFVLILLILPHYSPPDFLPVGKKNDPLVSSGAVVRRRRTPAKVVVEEKGEYNELKPSESVGNRYGLLFSSPRRRVGLTTIIGII